jgi:Ca2+-binding RTX toxin-like protein
MLFNSWLDSLRRVSSINRRPRGRVTRRAGRLGCAAEFLEDRVMLSAAHDPALIIASAEAASPDDYVAGEMLARFNPGFSDADKSAAIENLGGEILKRYNRIDVVLVKINEPAEKIVTDVKRFIASPFISYAHPNYRVYPSSTPNDPSFSSLWGLNNTGQTGGTVDADMDAVEAWSDFTGTSHSVVAVIDTGIDYTHPDLAANMWVNPGEIPGDGLDNDNNGWIDDVHGYDFSDGDSDIIDAGFHGSHVSGTVGAVGNNGVGVVGVNWNVSLMGVKIFPNANLAAVVGAVQYVVTMRETFGVEIEAINASYRGLSSTGGFAAEEDSITDAIAAGVVFVAAAGNDAINNDGSIRAYPASYDLAGIIAVAATDDRDLLASYSNYGATTVDLGAPGTGILSTVPASRDPSLYDSISGTSMAAPQVAGAVALLRGLKPSLTVAQTKAAILNTVDAVSDLSGKAVTGGRLNVAAAVTEVAGNVVASARESVTSNKNDDGIGDTFVVKRDGSDLVITINSVETDRVVYANVTGVAILGSSDDDTLTIDHTGGVINVPMIYTAFDGDNVLKVIGDLDYTLADSGSGLVSSNAGTAVLFSPGAGTAELAYVDSVELTGGSTANLLVATTFTRGSVVLNGGGGNDTLSGTSGDDTLNGGSDDDVLLGGSGDDILNGDTGSDQIRQTVNSHQVLVDTLVTGEGSDTLSSIEEAQLTGGANPNSLDASGFSGSVTLTGLDGNDTLYGAAGDDVLDGGLGTDQVRQSINADQLLTDLQLTGMGTDTLVSIEQGRLTGGVSTNSLDASGFSGNATLWGLDGDDTLYGGASADLLDGGNGTDQVRQSINADQLLTDSQLTGMGPDALLSIEEAQLTGGSNPNTLDASAFNGSVTLAGLDGNDTLHGAAGDDLLDGGLGTDQVRQSVNDDQILTNSQLTGMGTDALLSIEEAQLTGGSNPNTLDASAFNGSVTLAGLDGDDTLYGGASADLLDGGNGTDQVRQSINADQLLTDSQLTGMGPDALLSIEQAQLTGGIGNNTLDASGFSAGPVTLWGLDGDDTLYGSSSADVINGDAGTDQIRQTIDANQVLVDTLVTGDGNDTLSSIEQAQLTGGSSGNSIDASGFTGPVTLTGLDGDDLLWGGTANDSLEGGNGNDTLWGQAGDDSLDGGSDTDLVRQTVDADQALFNTLLTGEGSDLLANIETGWLTGGNSGNAIDASGFNLGPVTLAGAAGNDSLTGSDQDDSIDGGTGTDLVLQTVDANQTLTDTSLTGRGTDSLLGIELASLTGGNSDNRIDAAAFTGTVTLVAAGGDDTLVGATGNDSLDAGPGNDLLEQTADADQVLTNSSVTGDGNDTLAGVERAILTGGASDNTLDPRNFTLGPVTLIGQAGNDTLYGSPGDDLLDGGSGSDQVRQEVNIDQVLTDTSLSGQGSDVLSSIEEAILTGGIGDNDLDASGFTSGPVTLIGGDGDDTLTGTVSSDTLDGGLGTDTGRIVFDGDLVLDDTSVLGLGNDNLISIERFTIAGGNGPNRIDASAFTLGSVTLDGAAGDDTLLGSTSDDQLIGGTGNDTLEQSVDADMVLTDSSLTGMGTDAHSGFENVLLTGGASDNSIDASAFTGSGVTLVGGSGNDTLAGSPGNDSLDGGNGTDRITQTIDANQTLTNAAASGHGNDVLVAVEEALLKGGSGDNTLDAESFTLGPVTLLGQAGDDTLTGSASNDSIDGGTGTDMVQQFSNSNQALTDNSLTGMGTDSLTGIESAWLVGGPSSNTLDASGFNLGPVTLWGQGGDDTLHGSPGDDALDGGNGSDHLVQVTDSDQTLSNTTLTGHGTDSHNLLERVQLTGGAGDNRLDASAFTTGLVTLAGNAGNDTLIGGHNNDLLDGGTGTDQVQQTTNTDQSLSDSQLTGQGTDSLLSIESAVLNGGTADNLIEATTFSLGPVTLVGNAGDDTLVGGAGSDWINGGSGSDWVRQTSDTDQVITNTMLTGRGNDILSSIEQAELTGGLSDNRIAATAFTVGPVTLDGNAGNDTLLGSAGDDSLEGGSGFDQVEQTTDTDQVLTSSSLTGMGNDVLSSIEKAVLTGGNSDNSIDALGFDSGTATLQGNDGNDTLVGSPGDDSLDGGIGNDLVVSSGDVDFVLSDTVIVGAGNDVLVDVEMAHLAGGNSANHLDASSFSGNTTLEGGSGDDTLLGGSGIDLVLQTADADQVLTTTALSGSGQNTLVDIDQAHLIGGVGDNLLDASAFTPGPVTLEGAGGDDTLHGSAGDDDLHGGDGTDRVISHTTTNQLLTDLALTSDSNDTLSGIEEAELHGSASDNVLDASGFSGNTTLHGTAGNDTLAGGTGVDLLRQTADVDQVLSDSQLTGNGTDVISNIEIAWLTGGVGNNTLNAHEFSAGSVTLDGAAGDDTLLGGTGDDRLIGSDGIDQVQQRSDNDQLLVDSLLSGEGDDLLESIEEARLSGGPGGNLLDATDFSAGPVTLAGEDGNDTLRGSIGDDSLDGGNGNDHLEQTTDNDQSLTNSQLTGRGTDQLNSVETAELIGGAGDNVISASSFTLGSVTLEGNAGDDNLTGGSRGDSIGGGDGDDVANGRGGDDRIEGGAGDDSFGGGAGADTLVGDSGDDTLKGQGGRDSINGGDGNDLLDGQGSPDTVVGGAGDDVISGGSSGDVLNGSSGNDLINGDSGSDRAFGGSGADTLDGGVGADRLNGQGGSGDLVLGNSGDDTLRGGTGNDVIDGGDGYDELREGGDDDYLLLDNSLSGLGIDQITSMEAARLTGGGGDNVIDTTGFSGPVTLRGSGGDDLLQSGPFDDLMQGGNGDDTLESGLGLDTLNGGSGFDRTKNSGDGDFVITDNSITGPATVSLIGIEAVEIIAGPGDNLIDASGFSGNAMLWGGGGRDVITGGTGDDWLNGNDGEDALTGGGGNDMLHGGEGADLMIGGDGNDTLNGEAGDDTIDGGSGDDQLIGEEGRDRLLGRDGDDSLYGGPGNDQLLGHAGRDRLNGEAGNDTLLGGEEADALWGGNGNDVISGDADNDRLFGQSGNDTLLGESGNDRLQGGSARDVLQGGDGDDTLNGQTGHDTLGGGDGKDRINPHDNSMVVNELFALPEELFDAIDAVRAG